MKFRFFPVIVVSGGNGKPGLSVIRSDGTECDVDLGEVPQVRWLFSLPAFAQAVLPLTKLALRGHEFDSEYFLLFEAKQNFNFNY